MTQENTALQKAMLKVKEIQNYYGTGTKESLILDEIIKEVLFDCITDERKQIKKAFNDGQFENDRSSMTANEYFDKIYNDYIKL